MPNPGQRGQVAPESPRGRPALRYQLLERVSRGLVERRQREAGRLPTADDLGEAIAAAALDPGLPSGHTVAVGADPSSPVAD